MKYALGATPGRQLGSVALRYRRPMCPRRGYEAVRPAGHLVFWRPVRDELSDGDGAAARSAPLQRLEAVLLLSREPQSSRKLARLAGLADGTEARTLVRTLNRLYDTEGCAFRVEEVAGGFQLLTRSKFAPWLRRLHSVSVEVRLSAPATETLAVVAYRQPVLRAEVEAIRGVQCGEILRQLIERDLVKIVGRSEELGRPLLYGTTKRFLQVFGLRHLDELAPVDPFSAVEPAPPGGEADDGTGTAETAEGAPNQIHHCRQAEEEEDVKSHTLSQAGPQPAPMEYDETVVQPVRGERSDEELPFDDDLDLDDDYDDEYEEEEDYDEEEEEEEEELEDEPWQEVEDDEDAEEDYDEDEDEDEEEGEDWDEDEDEEEDEDWDEDEDEDWDEDED